MSLHLYFWMCYRKGYEKRCLWPLCQLLTLLSAYTSKDSFINWSLQVISNSAAEWKTNCSSTKGITAFPGFKRLLFPHHYHVLLVLSLSMIRWHLLKELIGIQQRGGTINHFWGGRKMGRNSDLDQLQADKKIVSSLADLLQDAAHTPIITLKTTYQDSSSPWLYQVSHQCIVLSWSEAEARRKNRKQEWFFFSSSFYFLAFHFSPLKSLTSDKSKWKTLLTAVRIDLHFLSWKRI